MVNKNSVYKCKECGTVVESLWNSNDALQCNGNAMAELVANTTDAAKEKHVPVIERSGNKVTVKVGSVAHPMTKEHYILFIELIAGDKVLRHNFKEGDTVAQAEFLVEEGIPVQAREFCNLHGLWGTK
jgi:superoxide reductase